MLRFRPQHFSEVYARARTGLRRRRIRKWVLCQGPGSPCRAEASTTVFVCIRV